MHAADRPDRTHQTQLHGLVTELGGIADAARHAAPTMFEPLASPQAADDATS